MKMMYQLGAPQVLFRWCQRLSLPLEVSCLLLFLMGLGWGFGYAPADYQQGDAFRIIYLHVPAAIGSMAVFTMMAIASAVYLIWRVKAAAWIAVSAAPAGALLTALALVTGAIWGKPMWGTWWVWDARLTSELILLFLYLGYMGLYSAFPHKARAYKICALFCIIAWVDIPIIHFSVEWWQTLHQGSTITRLKPTMTLDMLLPLVVMLMAFAFYVASFILQRLKAEIVMANLQTEWLKQWLKGEQNR
ncbi:MAG: heme ABC transporter permease CcmC [Gammaproteobacteria bacterium]|jgi:heme exporter protein C